MPEEDFIFQSKRPNIPSRNYIFYSIGNNSSIILLKVIIKNGIVQQVFDNAHFNSHDVLRPGQIFFRYNDKKPL